MSPSNALPRRSTSEGLTRMTRVPQSARNVGILRITIDVRPGLTRGADFEGH
jgi:hypothetical protein